MVRIKILVTVMMVRKTEYLIKIQRTMYWPWKWRLFQFLKSSGDPPPPSSSAIEPPMDLKNILKICVQQHRQKDLMNCASNLPNKMMRPFGSPGNWYCPRTMESPLTSRVNLKNNGFDAARITLWASIWPTSSKNKVTSTKSVLSRIVNKVFNQKDS